jgi:hypothetical protein
MAHYARWSWPIALTFGFAVTTVIAACQPSGPGTPAAPTVDPFREMFQVHPHMPGMHDHAAPPTSGASLRAQLSVDGRPDGLMRPGQSAAWEIGFSDAGTGAPFTRFDLHHERAMHLIVVKRDLSTFAHLHPVLGADGRFRLHVNAPGEDADNRDAPGVVSRPGTYLLFAEVAPSGQSARLSRFTVRAEGEERDAALSPDLVAASGEVEKAVGDRYRVSLRMARGEHHPGMPMLTFTVTVRERDAQGGYSEVRDFEPWLGMTGHAVLVGAAGDRVADRVFRHLHAGHGDHAAGGPLSFMAMAQDVPSAGLYRLWCQFKHRGQVQTVPFTLRL